MYVFMQGCWINVMTMVWQFNYIAIIISACLMAAQVCLCIIFRHYADDYLQYDSKIQFEITVHLLRCSHYFTANYLFVEIMCSLLAIILHTSCAHSEILEPTWHMPIPSY